ncbi:MAG TPA: LCP family protein [Thermopolyspora sp.]
MRLGEATRASAGSGGGGRREKSQPPDSPARFARGLTTASIIGWTALSAIAPGAAHLRAGKRRTGLVLFGIFVFVLIAAIIIALVIANSGTGAGFAVKDSTLLSVIVITAIGALAWFALIVFSYITLSPNRLPQNAQITSGIAVGVLSVMVMTPFALTAATVQTARNVTNTIFAPGQDGTTQPPVKQDDPWNGRHRVNFLLIGGDAAGDRTGVRTDSMTVASVNVVTGNTVLFSLPRNLQFTHFPKSSPLAAKFPDGFRGDSGQGLLNEVWYYVENHPEVQRGGRYRGPDALMDAISYILGIKIDYYALVDMYGFAALIDAIGGLKIRVERDVKWGGHFGTAGTIKAGYRKLNGEEVLWYGRSRVDSDDFSRMARQRCVIGALTQQATPAVVLNNFTRIAHAAKRLFKTNIPRDLLQHLVPLGLKVKAGKITSLQFVPPIIYTGNPDWHKIRVLTAKALKESAAGSRDSLAAQVTATPSGATPPASPTRSVTATPRQTPTPNDSGRAAKNLNELCGF